MISYSGSVHNDLPPSYLPASALAPPVSMCSFSTSVAYSLTLLFCRFYNTHITAAYTNFSRSALHLHFGAHNRNLSAHARTKYITRVRRYCAAGRRRQRRTPAGSVGRLVRYRCRSTLLAAVWLTWKVTRALLPRADRRSKVGIRLRMRLCFEVT